MTTKGKWLDKHDLQTRYKRKYLLNKTERAYSQNKGIMKIVDQIIINIVIPCSRKYGKKIAILVFQNNSELLFVKVKSLFQSLVFAGSKKSATKSFPSQEFLFPLFREIALSN